MLGEIAAGWVATPVAAGVLALLLLFVMDNVFDLRVSRPVTYRLDTAVVAELNGAACPTRACRTWVPWSGSAAPTPSS